MTYHYKVNKINVGSMGGGGHDLNGFVTTTSIRINRIHSKKEEQNEERRVLTYLSEFKLTRNVILYKSLEGERGRAASIGDSLIVL